MMSITAISLWWRPFIVCDWSSTCVMKMDGPDGSCQRCAKGDSSVCLCACVLERFSGVMSCIRSDYSIAIVEAIWLAAQPEIEFSKAFQMMIANKPPNYYRHKYYVGCRLWDLEHTTTYAHTHVDCGIVLDSNQIIIHYIEISNDICCRACGSITLLCCVQWYTHSPRPNPRSVPNNKNIFEFHRISKQWPNKFSRSHGSNRVWLFLDYCFEVIQEPKWFVNIRTSTFW